MDLAIQEAIDLGLFHFFVFVAFFGGVTHTIVLVHKLIDHSKKMRALMALEEGDR